MYIHNIFNMKFCESMVMCVKVPFHSFLVKQSTIIKAVKSKCLNPKYFTLENIGVIDLHSIH